MKEIMIGIDTGKNTGICVYKRKTKEILLLASYHIHAALEAVEYYNGCYPGEVHVRVEDARLRKWIPKQKNEKWERAKAVGAGSVKRDATIWEDFLKAKNISYEMIAPKDNLTKLDAWRFKKFTNWQGSSNEHSRDAAMLVYGY